MQWLYKRADYISTLENTLIAGRCFRSGATEISKKLLEQLDEMDEAKLEYWLKTVMFNRLQNRIDSLANQNIEEQMERL